MSAFSDDVKRRVTDAIDIVDLIRSYGIELKRSGRRLVARCPFHIEKTPSFGVNPEGQYFKCFGCGKGGDIFTFVMLSERVEFPDALRMLAERAGIPLETNPAAANQTRRMRDWKTYLYKLNSAAADFYREKLFSAAGAPARAYLEKRKISEESVRRFGLGFAPAGGSPLLERLTALKAPPGVLARTGLASTRDDGSMRDYFYNRLMFPIRDAQGRVIGFGGRVLDNGEPKYLNTRETPLFGKSKVCYGIFEARDALVAARRAVLVEGYTDVIMCHQHGVRHVVAALGTAVTQDHLKVLRRLVDEVILLTDEDEAGRAAGERGTGVLFQEDIPARVAHLPGKAKDPCDFLLASGREAFEAALGEGLDPFDYKFQRVSARHKLAAPDGQAAAAKEMLELISLSPNPLRRSAYRRKLSDLLNLPEEDLKPAPIRPAMPTKTIEDAFTDEAGNGPPPPESPAAGAEREFLRFLFHEPAWLELAPAQVDLTGFSGKAERILALAFLAALDDNELPPAAETLQPKGGEPTPSPAALTAREIMPRLEESARYVCGENADEQEVHNVANTARALCIALAEEEIERRLLKPQEDFAMRVQTLKLSRLELDLAAARRAESAAKQCGDVEAAEDSLRRAVSLRKELALLRAAR